MVLATMGLIALIAAPKLSHAADNARAAQTTANERALQDAIDLYTAEHGFSPATNPDGSVTFSGVLFVKRLTMKTDDLGNIDDAGIYGPYLRSFPRNAYNGLVSLRIDGATAGANAAAWSFDSATAKIVADDAGVTARKALAAAVAGGSEAVTAQLGGTVEN